MKVVATLIAAQAIPGVRAVQFNGTTWNAYEPGDTLPARAPDGLPDVEMVQLRDALTDIGKLAAFDAAVASVIAGIADPTLKAKAQNWANYARRVPRAHPLLAQVITAMGVTQNQADNLFAAAATL